MKTFKAFLRESEQKRILYHVDNGDRKNEKFKLESKPLWGTIHHGEAKEIHATAMDEYRWAAKEHRKDPSVEKLPKPVVRKFEIHKDVKFADHHDAMKAKEKFHPSNSTEHPEEFLNRKFTAYPEHTEHIINHLKSQGFHGVRHEELAPTGGGQTIMSHMVFDAKKHLKPTE